MMRSSFISSIFDALLPSLPIEPPFPELPLRKYWPHRALPASFFKRFSLARLHVYQFIKVLIIVYERVQNS